MATTARKGFHVRRHTPLESVLDQENRDNREVQPIKKDFGAVLKSSHHILPQLESNIKPESEVETILVTGGAGYIGTHTIVLLLNAGFNVAVVDNLINSSEEGTINMYCINNCYLSETSFITIHVSSRASKSNM